MKAPGRARRAGLAALGAAAVLVVSAGLVMAVLSRGIVAPDWLQTRIETRLDAALPGLDVDLGAMRLQLAVPGGARVGLRNVRLASASGGRVADLADVALLLDAADLARGRVTLRRVQVTGVFVTLARRPDGRLGLAFGSAFAGGPAPDLTETLAALDRALSDRRLAALREIEAAAVTLRYEDRRAGRGWTLDGGRLRLSREGDRVDLFADLALLGGGDRAASVEVTAESRIGSTALEFGVVLRDLPAGDIATQSPALAWLEALDAPISGALRSGVAPDGALRRMDATLQIGAGALAPNPAARPIPFDGARTYFTYLPETRVLRFDEIAVRSPLGEVLAEGQARLDPSDSGLPGGLWAQMRLTRVATAGGAVLERDVTVDGAQATFRLSLDPFRVDLGSLRVMDPGLPVRASGLLRAGEDGWALSLDARAARTDVAQVLSLWPDGLRPQARDWVSRHVRAAVAEDAVVAIRARQGRRPLTHLDMRFRDAQVAYSLKLPEIAGGAGRLTISDDRLAVRLDEGRIETGGGPVDIAGSAFVIPDLERRGGPGTVTLRAEGSARAALSYLDNPSWRLLEKAGRGPDLLEGRAELAGRITLPLRKGVRRADVALDLSGTLSDVESDRLVAGRTLTAETLRLAVDDTAVRVSGPVNLDGVAADVTWRRPMEADAGATVEGTVALSPEALSAFGIALPDGLLSGAGEGRLALTFPPGRAPAFRLESDLAGLALDLPQLGWRLPRAETGRFEITGSVGARPRIDALSLEAPGLEARGTLALREGGGLETLTLAEARVGDWIDTAATLNPRPDGRMDVALRGGTFDLRRAPFGRGGSGGGAGGGLGRLDVALDRVQVTDTIALARFEGLFDGARGALAGRFSARVGGREAVAGQAIPQNGGVALRLTGGDAGDILEAAGLLDNVQDGTFALDLAPVAGAAGQYDGLLSIEGARLRGAPAIAALLDAVSVVGLIDQLNGPGIFFSEVEARFRLTPDRVILSRGSAVGPSMGISMDGYYGLQSRRMDLQGVLSPVYILNGIGRLIARKGEGLIGFNFNLRGTRGAPDVSVNPLSVFTPGMFRDIFRRPPPTLSD